MQAGEAGSDNLSDLVNAGRGGPATPARAVYTFPLPKEVAKAAGFDTISVVELTVDDEDLVNQRCGMPPSPLKIALYSLQHAFVGAGKRPLNIGDGSVEEAYSALGAQGRALLLRAYHHIHTPKQEAVEDFLAGVVVKVG